MTFGLRHTGQPILKTLSQQRLLIYNSVACELLSLHGKVRMIFRKRESVEKMILAYLEQHPDAVDTIEGITSFWMQRQNAEIAIAKVSHTLKKLAKKGRIKVFQSLDGTIYYKLKRDRPEREQTVH